MRPRTLSVHIGHGNMSVPCSLGNDIEHVLDGLHFLLRAFHPNSLVLVLPDVYLVLSRVQQVNDVLIVYLQVLTLDVELSIGKLATAIIGENTQIGVYIYTLIKYISIAYFA